MGNIVTLCPSCGSSKLTVTKIECSDCSTKFEGHFDIPSLLKLSNEDLEFIFQFIKCSGSLKEMANILDISYPTLRNRLNELISSITNLEKASSSQKDKILKLLEAGKITAQEAAKRLKNI